MGQFKGNAKYWIFAALAVVAVTGCAPTYQDGAPESMVVADRQVAEPPRGAFVHPKYGYLLVPIAGSRTLVPQGGGGAELIIQSPRGYIVTVEGRPIAKSKSVRDIANELENEFLGVGEEKRWNRKLGYRTYSMNGLTAYDVLYEGPDTQDRLVVLRGRKRDYLFMFFAPTQRYGRLAHEFDYLLDSFRLPEPGFVSQERGGMTEPASESSDAPSESSEPEVEMVPFPETNLGYKVSYPKAWMAKQNGPFSVVFSGPENSPAFYSTVIIQNVRPEKRGPAADAVLASLTRQLRDGAKEVSFSDVTAFLQGQVAGLDGGKQFTADFMHNNEAFRQWTIILPRLDSPVVHVLSYTSPAHQFEQYKKMAALIINSWRIVQN